jgi:hypothetical protein
MRQRGLCASIRNSPARLRAAAIRPGAEIEHAHPWREQAFARDHVAEARREALPVPGMVGAGAGPAGVAHRRVLTARRSSAVSTSRRLRNSAMRRPWKFASVSPSAWLVDHRTSAKGCVGRLGPSPTSQ